MLAIVLMCTLFSSKDVYAVGGRSDKITVSNVTSTSAHIDWAGVFNLIPKYGTGTVENVRYNITVGSILVAENSTETSATVNGLTPDTYYSVKVNLYYTHVDTDYRGETTEYEGWIYDWESFSTGEPQNVYTSTPNTTSQQTVTTTSTPQPTQPAQPIVLAKPYISDVAINRYGTVAALAKNVDVNNTSALEWQIFDKKTNKCVKTYTSYNTAASISGVNGRKVYYIKCRAVGRDSSYNYVYSDWSDAKYFVTQPKVTSQKSDVHKNSITIKWKKIPGAKNYTIYAKKSTSNKWVKVKTTKGNRFVFSKLKGQTIDTFKNTYNFAVTTNAKAGKKTVKSAKEEAYSAHSYYTYR